MRRDEGILPLHHHQAVEPVLHPGGTTSTSTSPPSCPTRPTPRRYHFYPYITTKLSNPSYTPEVPLLPLHHHQAVQPVLHPGGTTSTSTSPPSCPTRPTPRRYHFYLYITTKLSNPSYTPEVPLLPLHHHQDVQSVLHPGGTTSTSTSPPSCPTRPTPRRYHFYLYITTKLSNPSYTPEVPLLPLHHHQDVQSVLHPGGTTSTSTSPPSCPTRPTPRRYHFYLYITTKLSNPSYTPEVPLLPLHHHQAVQPVLHPGGTTSTSTSPPSCPTRPTPRRYHFYLYITTKLSNPSYTPEVPLLPLHHHQAVQPVLHPGGTTSTSTSPLSCPTRPTPRRYHFYLYITTKLSNPSYTLEVPLLPLHHHQAVQPVLHPGGTTSTSTSPTSCPTRPTPRRYHFYPYITTKLSNPSYTPEVPLLPLHHHQAVQPVLHPGGTTSTSTSPPSCPTRPTPRRYHFYPYISERELSAWTGHLTGVCVYFTVKWR